MPQKNGVKISYATYLKLNAFFVPWFVNSILGRFQVEILSRVDFAGFVLSIVTRSVHGLEGQALKFDGIRFVLLKPEMLKFLEKTWTFLCFIGYS
jgi:hypothetical protein